MTKTPSVGRTIKDARTRAGKTLEQLGYEADLTAATVSRIESGKHSPTLRTLEQIAKALGLAPGKRYLIALLGEAPPIK